MTLLDTETRTPMREDAAVIIACIEEALERLDGLAPHPSRTDLGRHLLAARAVALGWRDANGYGGHCEATEG